jgi:phage repressor protein C with HTH and peptisase S24 domain
MMWAQLVQELKEGKQVQCRPKGNSMQPKIYSGQLITIDPNTSNLQQGDIVFCKVGGNFYVHLISAVGQDGRYQISNNSGHVNGWTKAIYGKVVRVEP